MTQVSGETTPEFAAVRTAFEQQFEVGQHIGAAVAVYHRGVKVVDLWGGMADESTGRPWERDTIAITFSTTKGITATCLHLLADRGLVRYDDPVAKYWPEFAQNGKEAITVHHVLTHQSAVSQIPDALRAEDMTDWDRVVGEIAKLEPAWTPGEETGYHAMNFGWLVGEIVRRIDGRSIGTFLRDEIAKPLALADLHLGAPEEIEPRIAPVISRDEVTPEQRKMYEAVFGPDTIAGRSLGPRDGGLNELLNSRAGHAAEIPAVGGIFAARDLARFYACLANYGELDGVRLMSEATVREASRKQTLRPDKVIIVPVCWSRGYMNGQPGWPQGARETSFGHIGFGGSVGFANPEIGMSFGLVVSKLEPGLIGAGRTSTLAEVARAAAEAVEKAA